MSTVIEGMLDGTGKKFGIVAGRFNELITKKLLEGCLDCLIRHNTSREDITICWAPGSFEIPLCAKKMARSGRFHAVICLGSVIRGATPHFDYVAAEVSKGIAGTMLSTELPVLFGVLTTDTIEQAVERAGTKSGNKGWSAALSALEMADLMARLDFKTGKHDTQ